MPDRYENFLPPLDLPSVQDDDRRGFLRKIGMAGAAIAAGPVAGSLLNSPAAFGLDKWEEPSPENRVLLPAIGQEINCDCKAFGTTLVVNLPPPLPTLDFRGRIKIKILVGGPDFVRLQVLNHTVAATHPMFGEVVITLPTIDISPASILKLGPGGFLQTMLLSFSIKFQRCGDCEGPFSFETLSPAKLTASMFSFPPGAQSETTRPDGTALATGGQLYKLASPIQIGSGGTQFAQLHGMDINVGKDLMPI
ncbi:secreted protein [Lentzea atacamensis]|uniref:Secreted protein n=1 Tax=Lentzea atacamensis TaxID=531938 RepID=A0A316IR32_9PSEU|nr:twin-arginine translocation signal domain-containing protein [Lentzea atacamensis]PWK89595.1 secreted protein [Lentzea atacamensis]RAS60625.1 secreted protein [Lentzea atacamensis]